MFDSSQRQQLLKLAAQSIQWGLQHGRALPVDDQAYDRQLQQPLACFVTLHLDGQLRGCIGTLEAHQSLIRDVSDNAFAAAFRDPRFAQLQQQELEALKISISVLSRPQIMSFQSEADLKSQIRPGIDGLILQEDHHRGTFLPSVWEQLPEVDQFLQHLKIKAGLAKDHWSSRIMVSRYQAETIE